ncbi:MAG: hypothetical protein JWQ42_5158 [Edaphobacter sp.]|nr:hypothetical protein [Edaphobacter sp.]
MPNTSTLETTELELGPALFKHVSTLQLGDTMQSDGLVQRIEIETAQFMVFTQDQSLAGQPNVVLVPQLADLHVTGDHIRIVGLLKLPGREVKIACRLLEFILPIGMQDNDDSPRLGIDVTPEPGHDGVDAISYQNCPANAVAPPSDDRIRLLTKVDWFDYRFRLEQEARGSRLEELMKSLGIENDNVIGYNGSIHNVLEEELLGLDKVLVRGTAPCGAEGGAAGHGSRGGSLSIVALKLFADEQVLLRADGARGGKGGRGTDGADGIDGHQTGLELDIRFTENEGDGWPGVPGGHGGKGGDGGSGGRGGTIRLCVESILPAQPWDDKEFKFFPWTDGSIVNRARYEDLAHWASCRGFPPHALGTPGFPCDGTLLTTEDAAIIVCANGGFGGSGGSGGHGGNGGKGADAEPAFTGGILVDPTIFAKEGCGGDGGRGGNGGEIGLSGNPGPAGRLVLQLAGSLKSGVDSRSVNKVDVLSVSRGGHRHFWSKPGNVGLGKTGGKGTPEYKFRLWISFSEGHRYVTRPSRPDGKTGDNGMSTGLVNSLPNAPDSEAETRNFDSTDAADAFSLNWFSMMLSHCKMLHMAADSQDDSNAQKLQIAEKLGWISRLLQPQGGDTALSEGQKDEYGRLRAETALALDTLHLDAFGFPQNFVRDLIAPNAFTPALDIILNSYVAAEKLAESATYKSAELADKSTQATISLAHVQTEIGTRSTETELWKEQLWDCVIALKAKTNALIEQQSLTKAQLDPVMKDIAAHMEIRPERFFEFLTQISFYSGGGGMPFAKALPVGQLGNLVTGLSEDLNSISIDGRPYPKGYVIREIKKEVKVFAEANSDYQITADEILLVDNTRSFMVSRANMEEWLDKLDGKLPGTNLLAVRSSMAQLIEKSSCRQEEVIRYNTLAARIQGLQQELHRLKLAKQFIDARTSSNSDLGISALAAHRTAVCRHLRAGVLSVLRRASGALAYATLNSRERIFKELFELLTEKGNVDQVLDQATLLSFRADWIQKITIPAHTTSTRPKLHTSEPELKGTRIIFDETTELGMQYLSSLKEDGQVTIDLAPGFGKSKERVYFKECEVRIDRVCCYLAGLGEPPISQSDDMVSITINHDGAATFIKSDETEEYFDHPQVSIVYKYERNLWPRKGKAYFGQGLEWSNGAISFTNPGTNKEEPFSLSPLAGWTLRTDSRLKPQLESVSAIILEFFGTYRAV